MSFELVIESNEVLAVALIGVLRHARELVKLRLMSFELLGSLPLLCCGGYFGV